MLPPRILSSRVISTPHFPISLPDRPLPDWHAAKAFFYGSLLSRNRGGMPVGGISPDRMNPWVAFYGERLLGMAAGEFSVLYSAHAQPWGCQATTPPHWEVSAGKKFEAGALFTFDRHASANDICPIGGIHTRTLMA